MRSPHVAFGPRTSLPVCGSREGPLLAGLTRSIAHTSTIGDPNPNREMGRMLGSDVWAWGVFFSSFGSPPPRRSTQAE